MIEPGVINNTDIMYNLRSIKLYDNDVAYSDSSMIPETDFLIIL